MKAIIFATSMKQGKNSNSKAWCDELNSTFKQNNISSEVITLKDYDYEASTGKDLLHEQMYKLYDADLIFFTSPINFSYPTFYLRNLLERFAHAQTKASQKGLDIFANKRIEMLPVSGCTTDSNAPKDSNWEEYEEKNYPGGELTPSQQHTHPPRHHRLVYQKLNFIKALGLLNLHLNSWNPVEPIGPDRNTMHGHPQTVATIDRIMKKIKTLGMHLQENKPEHTIEEFVECFKSNDVEHAFGRGLTLAVENLNLKSAQKHIEYLNNNKELTSVVRYQAIVAMKDRSVKAGMYEVAELYYNQQARHDMDWYEGQSTAFNKNGNYRPNDY
tara:strand:+ start:125 stop:1111 length:987 start_codon:yes stop_codon:yes gene_type:complete